MFAEQLFLPELACDGFAFRRSELRKSRACAGARCELFLVAEDGREGFDFLLNDAADVGCDVGIVARAGDAHGHAGGVSRSAA